MRLVQRFGFAVVVFGILVSSAPVLAQPCSTDLPERNATGGGRLAVRLSGDWKLFDPDGGTSALQLNGLQQLCMAWEAPPHDFAGRQIVYVSTRYTDLQGLWLFRKFPEGRLLPARRPWSWFRSGVQALNGFEVYHGQDYDEVDDGLRDRLNVWHESDQPSARDQAINADSYGLVSAAVGSLGNLPYGSERLLPLRAARPWTSWVPFDTHAPSGQDELRVAIAYSGDLESRGPRVYRYAFRRR